MLMPTVASYLICFASLLGLSAADEYQFFQSRPELFPPVLEIDILKEGVTPGYIFVSPHHIPRSGAAIYDNNGQLIWTSLSSMLGGSMHTFSVCKYKGSDHLCFFRGDSWATYYAGDAHIYSNELVPVATIKAQNGRPAIDMHECNLVEDGRSMIVDIYQVERYDLTPYGLTSGEGWIRDGLFQKIDVATGELLFEWSALDHISPSESYVGLGTNIGATAGTGFDAVSAWDWIHLNAVDETPEGDYIVSCRHTQAIYKVSGKDGQILWRLGGKKSDFALEAGVLFGYQHHVRWHSSNGTTEIITLFDNASNGVNFTSPRASGKIIKLEHNATPPRATLLAAFQGPEGMISPATQGSMQLLGERADLARSNVLMGWGQEPYVTEHLPSGEIVFQAKINATGANLYRAFKFNFTSNPFDNPALYTYALNADAALTMFYMSWNGATEVAQWRVYGRQNCTAEWSVLGTVNKTGFETSYQASGYWTYGMVEALDRGGRSLRHSATNGVKTFVPTPILAQNCNQMGCKGTRLMGVAPAGQSFDQPRGGCPFTPTSNKASAHGALERVGLHGGLGLGTVLLFAGLLVCLLLSIAAGYLYFFTGFFRSTSASHTLIPQSDPEFEEGMAERERLQNQPDKS
ncbi:hypothetical protein A1O1_02820 [Capronia coronata CBS 617.96]|uniref:Arylsulfotransferase n=1 Tax=Capronia coronata CBS 617.96 TaxID=1182541 RepID=W9YXN5_9EURO|nr:uncharacterized protein A1O1_02820 [Capronia coronata CBS 617.96]EXJ94425.1 hypothetical protein A1O1_02820 [Capronia coronata CBS 617.96]